FLFFFSSRRRHTRFSRDWSSDVCSSDLSSSVASMPPWTAPRPLPCAGVAVKPSRAPIVVELRRIGPARSAKGTARRSGAGGIRTDRKSVVEGKREAHCDLHTILPVQHVQ